MASREFTPSEYHTNVSSLSFGMARTDTMNKELQTVRLQRIILYIDTFVYVLSSSGRIEDYGDEA